MNSIAVPKIAVIADAHLHDMGSDYSGATITIEGEQRTIRSWADTRRASRVFNESRMAFIGALTDIVDRDIKYVVLLGDYADDGQIEAVNRVVDIVQQFTEEHGLSFFALPGNHDFYGPMGKHQSTRFAVSPKDTVLVTSDTKIALQEPKNAIVTRKMFCLGAPEGLLPMAKFGLCKQSHYLHWETPFGLSDAVKDRQYRASSLDGAVNYNLMDYSYLVEPAPNLWLLMLDANVFEPRNGQWNINQKKAFLDSSDAGWNSVLRNKPYLLDWISDVCKRASEQGKCLLTFSHYPVLDPFNDAGNDYETLFGDTEISRRKPTLEVAEKLLKAGLRLHFGGHMHVNRTNQFTIGNTDLIDVSVPSPVACPAGYTLIQTMSEHCHVETISLATLPLDSSLIGFYKAELLAHHEPIDAALKASDYGDFLYERLYSRVQHRYFVKDWPTEVVRDIRGATVAGLLCLFTLQKEANEPLSLLAMGIEDQRQVAENLTHLFLQNGFEFEKLQRHPLSELIVDWYCLRDSGDQALNYIDSDHLKLYQFISTHFTDTTIKDIKSTAEFFSILLQMMQTPLRMHT